MKVKPKRPVNGWHTIKQILCGEFDDAPIEVRVRMAKKLNRHCDVLDAAVKKLLHDCTKK
jgi:hypothetical protein